MAREISLALVVLLVLGLWLATRLLAPGPGESGHPPGVHGDTVVSLGGGRYHVEAVFEAAGTLRLYTLGGDAARVIDVAEQAPTAWVRARGEAQAIAVALTAKPQPGDAAGRTSQFIGALPDELAGQTLEVTVPLLDIDGNRYRLAFSSPDGEHAPAMPAKVADEEERELYLVPGGRYTAADIEANGRRTASQAFRGFRARHDFNPRPGDRLCPVTNTKADPQCAWIINGQRYEFCCPPCVDEFVQLAKEQPERLREPDAYVKR